MAKVIQILGILELPPHTQLARVFCVFMEQPARPIGSTFLRRLDLFIIRPEQLDKRTAVSFFP